MKTALLAAAALLALPATATAYCSGGPSGGTIVKTCEDGVKVFRNTPRPLPRISPAQARSFEIERERLALERRRAADAFALQSRRLDQRDRQLSQTDYLYRDSYSPLRRNFAGHYGGFGGYTFGPVPGRTTFVGGFGGRRH